MAQDHSGHLSFPICKRGRAVAQAELQALSGRRRTRGRWQQGVVNEVGSVRTAETVAPGFCASLSQREIDFICLRGKETPVGGLWYAP